MCYSKTISEDIENCHTDEMLRRERLFQKGKYDFQSSVISLLQAQSKMFAHIVEHNLSVIMDDLYTPLLKEIDGIENWSSKIKYILNLMQLLSLNASIEASRAGEHGRGFGVVASEMGKLSNQTKESATEIDSISKHLIKMASTNNEALNSLVKEMRVFSESTLSMTPILQKITPIEENGFILTILSKRLQNHADFITNLIKNAGKQETISDHHTCAFGKWYDTNRSKYQHVTGYNEIYNTHKKFHEVASEFNKTQSISSLSNLVTLSGDILNEFIMLKESFCIEIEHNTTYFDI